jgi:hypothetical protein
MFSTRLFLHGGFTWAQGALQASHHGLVRPGFERSEEVSSHHSKRGDVSLQNSKRQETTINNNLHCQIFSFI